MGRSGIQMVENLNLQDHVWGLCNINRFCGKGDRQVSVGVHSLHCYELAKIWQRDNLDLQLFALTHDFSESYYNDVPGFLKKHYGPEFKLVNDEIDEIFYAQLGLARDVRVSLSDDLHRIDNNALAIEASYAFDKYEPYHWPPMDLYDRTDIVSDWVEHSDPVGVYNSILKTLDLFGVDNETLRNTLHRNSSISHPRRVYSGRRIPPCSGHAYSA